MEGNFEKKMYVNLVNKLIETKSSRKWQLYSNYHKHADILQKSRDTVSTLEECSIIDLDLSIHRRHFVRLSVDSQRKGQ